MDTVRSAYFHIQHIQSQGYGECAPFLRRNAQTYYFAAFVTDGVYSTAFIVGWTAFALLSPIFAYLAWMTKEKGVFPKIISIGIIAVSFLSSAVLFDRIRFYDIIINAVTAYFLFVKKTDDNLNYLKSFWLSPRDAPTAKTYKTDTFS